MNTVTFKLPTGIKVKSKITGITGTLTSRIQRINGCLQYAVDPAASPDKPNEAPEGTYIDFESLTAINAREVKNFKGDTHTFEHSVGDLLKSRINGFKGIATIARVDQNGCELYMLEGLKLNKDGGKITNWFFKQELTKVSDGLNTKQKKKTDPAPLLKTTTGARPLSKNNYMS